MIDYYWLLLIMIDYDWLWLIIIDYDWLWLIIIIDDDYYIFYWLIDWLFIMCCSLSFYDSDVLLLMISGICSKQNGEWSNKSWLTIYINGN